MAWVVHPTRTPLSYCTGCLGQFPEGSGVRVRGRGDPFAVCGMCADELGRLLCRQAHQSTAAVPPRRRGGITVQRKADKTGESE